MLPRTRCNNIVWNQCAWDLWGSNDRECLFEAGSNQQSECCGSYNHDANFSDPKYCNNFSACRFNIEFHSSNLSLPPVSTHFNFPLPAQVMVPIGGKDFVILGSQVWCGFVEYFFLRMLIDRIWLVYYSILSKFLQIESSKVCTFLLSD